MESAGVDNIRQELKEIRSNIENMTPFALACFLKSNITPIQIMESIVDYDDKLKQKEMNLENYINKRARITVLDGMATWDSKIGTVKNFAASQEKLFFKEEGTGKEFQFLIFSYIQDNIFKTEYGVYQIELI